MHKNFQIKNSNISYSVIPSEKAKKVSIHISGDFLVSVRKPKHITYIQLQDLMSKNIQVVTKLLEKARKRPQIKLETTHEEYKKTKDDVHEFFRYHVERENMYYNFVYENISIKKQKTRWGSCSSNKSLSLNFNISKLPLHLMRYVIVHELCHLKEMNHSKRFWDLVAIADPDYKLHNKELKNYLP